MTGLVIGWVSLWTIRVSLGFVLVSGRFVDQIGCFLRNLAQGGILFFQGFSYRVGDIVYLLLGFRIGPELLNRLLSLLGCLHGLFSTLAITEVIANSDPESEGYHSSETQNFHLPQLLIDRSYVYESSWLSRQWSMPYQRFLPGKRLGKAAKLDQILKLFRLMGLCCTVEIKLT